MAFLGRAFISFQPLTGVPRGPPHMAFVILLRQEGIPCAVRMLSGGQLLGSREPGLGPALPLRLGWPYWSEFCASLRVNAVLALQMDIEAPHGTLCNWKYGDAKKLQG